MTLSIDQRAQGCLVGLACGDAVGATVEFYLRGQFPPVTDMVGGGNVSLSQRTMDRRYRNGIMFGRQLIGMSKI